MIARPSTRQLLESVLAELDMTIKPAIVDEDVLTALSMITSILGVVIARSDDEAQWIRDEISEIEVAGNDIIAAGADYEGRVASALADLVSRRAPSIRLPDLHREYNAASNVLSRALEAASTSSPGVRAHVEAVLEHRLHREVLIRGDFSLTGRV